MSQTDTYTVEVGKIPTNMRVATPPPSSATGGVEFPFEGYLEDAAGNRLGGKEIQIFLNGVGQTKGTTDSSGVWAYSISIGQPGTFSMYVQFAGDATYEGCDADVENPHV